MGWTTPPNQLLGRTGDGSVTSDTDDAQTKLLANTLVTTYNFAGGLVYSGTGDVVGTPTSTNAQYDVFDFSGT